MATHNGLPWLKDQIQTVLSQAEVDVQLYVSDDISSDGTFEFLENIAKQESSIFLLPPKKIGSAGRNFYRLIKEVCLEDCDYVSFCDQDDLWELDKIIRHINLAQQHQADGVSSNVLAFWPDGNQKLIVKSQSLKKWDFIFESAGPGCSFLMTPWLVTKVREQLVDEHSSASLVVLHDWLTYAICRSHGHKWMIDSKSSLQYRQHENNAIGANSGLKAKWIRLVKLKQGWYRAEVTKVTKVCAAISGEAEVKKILALLKSKNIISQLKLLLYVSQARRNALDRLVLFILVLCFLF